MAVSIRLKMLGTKHRPSYRIVALDSRKNRDGITLDNLGMYDPLASEAKVEIKEEEIINYLNNGAIPSLTVKNLLRQKGIVRVQQKNEKGSVKLVWAKKA